MTPHDFMERWLGSAGSERANKDMFFTELCDVLDVPRPDPRANDPERDAYVFEATVPKLAADKTTTGFIDLYRKGAFVAEAKQGGDDTRGRIGTARRGTPGWHVAMHDAYGQALAYARALAQPPPFVIVVDIGHCIDVYAAFDGSGDYRPFPDAKRSRLWLKDLTAHVDMLRTIWTDPLALDPSRHAAKVTREVASVLAELARDLERAGHPAEKVSGFLIRAVFTMFAEDIELIPGRLFTKALKERWSEHPEVFPTEVETLWRTMDQGGQFGFERLPRFNGRLFKDPSALPLTQSQIRSLHDAARRDWAQVEPAIFGTLVERALDATERHALGAHYTPRSYVERLVRPSILDPIRAAWDGVLAEVRRNVERDQLEAAKKKVDTFLAELAHVRVLDPACGSGNFLYVTLDLLKGLEAEVVSTLEGLGVRQTGLEIRGSRVGPHQFYGIEKKPLARDIAEVVLWIGHLQWRRRLHGAATPAEPVLYDHGQVLCQDAVLSWDAVEPLRDAQGDLVTQWDRVSTRPHPVTGAQVPDETKRVTVERYVNARPAPPWPEVEFIVGNPPFLGTKRMRAALGDGYVDALRSAYAGEVEDNADLVMYWWHRAAQGLRAGVLRRFGLITTNSIGQVFNRRVLQRHLDEGVALLWAVPDHPWVDDASHAAVRIAMTVASPGGEGPARLVTVTREHPSPVSGEPPEVEISAVNVSVIEPDLGGEMRTTEVTALTANRGICGNGVALHGAGFIVDPAKAAELRRAPDDPTIRRYLGGRDLLRVPRELYLVDFSFMSEDEAEHANPAGFQHVLMHVKPERDQNRRAALKDRWWRFAWERPLIRKALQGLPRYVATTETAKHRVFQFLPAEVLPDHMILAFATADAFHLGVLSSRPHIAWTLRMGGTLEDRPRYNKNVCFDPFPFPDNGEDVASRIRATAEEIDAHRKTQQTRHPTLTMTDTYNVLAKLRAGDAFTAKDKRVHDQAVASVLLRLHDALDEAVLEAYGWSRSLTDEEIVALLVELNAVRASEEPAGKVRWLRPDLAEGAAASDDDTGDLEDDRSNGVRVIWPDTMAGRVKLVREALARGPTTVEGLAADFDGASPMVVADVLASLEALDIATQAAGTWKLH